MIPNVHRKTIPMADRRRTSPTVAGRSNLDVPNVQNSTRESYKDSSSSRNNGNISLKNRLSGFATSNYNSNRYESSTSHRSSRSDRNRFAYDYERNRGYERETYVKRNQDYKTERKPVDTGIIKFSKN